jgi:hypothetical protein
VFIRGTNVNATERLGLSAQRQWLYGIITSYLINSEVVCLIRSMQMEYIYTSNIIWQLKS